MPSARMRARTAQLDVAQDVEPHLRHRPHRDASDEASRQIASDLVGVPLADPEPEIVDEARQDHRVEGHESDARRALQPVELQKMRDLAELQAAFGETCAGKEKARGCRRARLHSPYSSIMRVPILSIRKAAAR